MYMGCGRDWVGMGHWSTLAMEVHVEKGGVWMGMYVLGKSSAVVLKINMFDIGNTYGVKNKNRSMCLKYLLDYVSLEMPNIIKYT